MLGFLGDIHGAVWILKQAAQRAKDLGTEALIQVGDFGFYPEVVEDLKHINLPLKVYAIDGNHENHPWLWEKGYSMVHAVTNGKVEYVHRGTVLELDGRRIGFLGGAGSIDERLRKRYGMSWHWEEQITDEDVARLAHHVDNPIDILVTHTPPQSVITAHFDTPPSRALQARQAFGAPPDWYDPSAHKVETVWQQFGKPQLFCGHMHRPIAHESCRIIAENELVVF